MANPIEAGIGGSCGDVLRRDAVVLRCGDVSRRNAAV